MQRSNNRSEHNPKLPEKIVRELTDGTILLFRPIRPDDKERMRKAFAHLSPESRYRRFFRPIEYLTEDHLDYLTDVDGEDHAAWVAVLPNEPGRPGVGVARWVRDLASPEEAEVAVTVLDAFQGRGIGTMLLKVATASAVAAGVKRFRASALGDNVAVIGMLHRLGVPAGRWESGILEITVELPENAPALIGAKTGAQRGRP